MLPVSRKLVQLDVTINPLSLIHIYKKARLKEEYGIIMTQEIESEVDYMYNLSQGIREEGIAEGLVEGFAEGIEKGVVKGTIDTTLYHVNQLIHRSGFSAAEGYEFAWCR